MPLQAREKLHGLEEVGSIGKPEGEAILARLADGYAVGVGIELPQIGSCFFSLGWVAVDGHGPLTPLGSALRRLPGIFPNRLSPSVGASGFVDGQVDLALVLCKDSLPGIRRQFRKSHAVRERRLVSKTEFGSDFLGPLKLRGALFGLCPEADGSEPGPARIEREAIGQEISRGLGGANERVVLLGNPSGVAQLVNQL